ncbi:hypothetical protein AB9E06_37925, partial [Rhizobium leguminosarum]|uniref:hypothetical protein n=1 Tax=Rhizobium leguminosarum TaxID=384 RepID=UPI003F9B2B3B
GLRHDKKGKFSKLVNRVPVAKIPSKATLVFLTFATSQTRRFCDAGNVCCWRKSDALTAGSMPIADFRELTWHSLGLEEF